jgi:hypothetical protein
VEAKVDEEAALLGQHQSYASPLRFQKLGMRLSSKQHFFLNRRTSNNNLNSETNTGITDEYERKAIFNLYREVLS